MTGYRSFAFARARDSPSLMDSESEPVEAIAADANRPEKEHEAAGASIR
jgi:hypothetical protein